MNHDQLIDTVARQMTESDPTPDFRARVIAALPARTQRSNWLRFAVPAAALGALAIAAVMSGAAGLEWSKRPKVQGSEGPGAATTLRSVESPVVVETSASKASGPLDRWTLGPLDRVEVPLSSRVPPLDEVTPLSIAPIQPIGLSIAPITVTPIVTEPLAVPVLDSRAGGRE